MKSRKIALLFILTGALLANATGWISCMPVAKNPYGLVDPFEPDPTDGTTNNNAFARASRVTLANDSAAFAAVLTTHDVDVYNIGSVAAGDKVIVDINIPDRVLLNAVVAIFDSVGRLFYINGETTQVASAPLTDAVFPTFTPHFEFVVRQASDPLYLAVASLPEASASGGFNGYTAGPYTINLSLQRGGLVPRPSKQTVALVFDNSIIDYPPVEAFGVWSDFPPIAFGGLNGRVLDPIWWRPLIIPSVARQQNLGNLLYWQNVLTFANASGLAIPNIANVLPPQVPGVIAAELSAAVQAATMNPNGLSLATTAPTAAAWFAANGFPWLSVYTLYLGPGLPTGGVGLNVYDSILPSTYPSGSPDPAYSDFAATSGMIRAQMNSMYAGLNIEFLIAGIDPIPTTIPVSRVYLVSNSLQPGVLGLASKIDMTNQDQTDFAVIFAGEFGFNNAMAIATGASNIMTTPAQVMGFVGFVATHELGHILGLVHTNSPADIMKTSGGTIADLSTRFGNAPLDSSMFPIGTQDSGLTLLLELGMKP